MSFKRLFSVLMVLFSFLLITGPIWAANKKPAKPTTTPSQKIRKVPPLVIEFTETKPHVKPSPAKAAREFIKKMRAADTEILLPCIQRDPPPLSDFTIEKISNKVGQDGSIDTRYPVYKINGDPEIIDRGYHRLYSMAKLNVDKIQALIEYYQKKIVPQSRETEVLQSIFFANLRYYQKKNEKFLETPRMECPRIEILDRNVEADNNAVNNWKRWQYNIKTNADAVMNIYRYIQFRCFRQDTEELMIKYNIMESEIK